ncbi:helix-turn-helix domain-containing protein [Carnobacteriaceae bacterium zg-ZUI78]|nr:helix-turn-helix domain-containing protein [Carnobacteriaceae bacterium zg-ZUI78]
MNNRIAEFRKLLGLSQHRLAKLVGLKRHSIMSYENKTKIPNIKVAYEISKVLNKDIKEVFIFE